MVPNIVGAAATLLLRLFLHQPGDPADAKAALNLDL
jgi:hypothetical protein